MVMEMRVLCALGCLAMQSGISAEVPLNSATDRIAAHFETMSSRLLTEDMKPLEQFVTRAENTPGAKLAVLVPTTNDPFRARFVAARVAELERRVRPLAENAELHRVPGNIGADVLWLAMIMPPPAAAPPEVPVSLAISPPAAKAAMPPSPATQQPGAGIDAADLRLTDWVVRGVKHPVQGPAYAYVARPGSTEAPREIVAQQTDKEFGLVKDIIQSPDGVWTVHTEIGWISQAPIAGSPDPGGH